MKLILSVFLVRNTKSIHLKFEVNNLFDFDTGVISNFGHVTCQANFKRANYNINLILTQDHELRLNGLII